jgi:hypothetical protein
MCVRNILADSELDFIKASRAEGHDYDELSGAGSAEVFRREG